MLDGHDQAYGDLEEDGIQVFDQVSSWKRTSTPWVYAIRGSLVPILSTYPQIWNVIPNSSYHTKK